MLLRLILSLAMLLSMSCPAQATGAVIVLELQGTIGPASSQFVVQGLETARRQQARLVVLRMDTPGGLDNSMREIIQAILSSPVAVATYVAPDGARAASAGTYILYASHIAAMAPATNLGAATPVQIGGLPMPEQPGPQPEPEQPQEGQPNKDKTAQPAPQEQSAEPYPALERKLINDARAYIRALAQLRRRNVDWAEQAVDRAASLSAQDALQLGVIDMIAVDVPELLRQTNGRVVRMAGGELTVNVSDAAITTIAPDWRTRLLSAITHPQVAYILLLLGIYGLFFEVAHPGAVAPGVLGGICLLLALFALQVLPINFAGLGLLFLGLLFMIAEAFIPSFGALGIGGIVAFIVGSLMLWDETGPGFETPLGIILGFAAASALILIGFGTMALRQRRRPVVTGAEQLLAATGVALEDFEHDGRVWVHSESWRAHSHRPLHQGEPVRVTGRDGLTLTVQPMKKGDSGR